MQAGPGSQKTQRRSSPMEDPEIAKPSHTTSTSSAASRTTSGAPAKSHNKRKDPQTQLSQIEKSVTHLLVATKQLLETLTQWSRHQATEGEVSDVYVRLGYEFNIACRAFGSIGVNTDDLGPVPDLLRNILEETLSQDASPQSLDRFLPRIRDIIINLLHGLKKKQSKLRASRGREGSGSDAGGQPVRQGSASSQDGVEPDFGKPTRASTVNRVGSQTIVDKRSTASQGSMEEPGMPQRMSSVPSANATRDEVSERLSRRTSARDSQYPPQMDSDSSLSTTTAQSLPVVLPEEDKGPLQRISLYEEPPPPPPPPKQQDALAALQRGGDLERRASRRHSAYQISKHLGASPGGVPMIPPPQHSPIPNRGRDVRESLNAVRQRTSFVGRQRSQLFQESATAQASTPPSRISEGSEGSDAALATASSRGHSPVANSLDDKTDPSIPNSAGPERPTMSSTVNGPPPDSLTSYDAYGQSLRKENSKPQSRPSPAPAPPPARPAEALEEQEQFIPEHSPQPGKELTLFLQYKSRIKKIILPGGSNDLSIPRLQLAFIEKFAWNIQNNGVDLPEIYIQDSVSGVRHELEDLTDIKDRSVLVLNVEALDEVKRHIDEGLGGLRKMVEGVRSQLDGQQLAISQVSDRQQDAAKEVVRITTAPPARNGPVQINGFSRTVPASKASMQEVQTLRRDIAVIRQTFSSFTTDVQSSMVAIRAKAETVKAKAVDVVPVLEGDTGRAYVNNGKKVLGDDSDGLVNKVDDLQDIVEDLRKDVVNRGVRPLARQLEAASKDISDANKELKKMQDYVKREKPLWTKIWEKELELVCNDREFLTMQEELIADLQDDLEKATQTMTLVEQATKQQNLQTSSPGAAPTSLRGNLRNVNIDNADVDPTKAKDGVLGQVKALQPNHESRLEAIERAEKARHRELESRQRDAAFKKELDNFVAESKLKKSGGFEETERLRRTKDERNLKDEWGDQQNRKAERARKREKERARQVQLAQAAAENPPSDEGGDYEERDEEIDEMHDAQTSNEADEAPHSQRGSADASPRKSWLPSFLSGSASGPGAGSG